MAKIDENFWENCSKEGAVLNPISRISEVLFGLIMVLTFTGAISAANSGRQEVIELLWAALGCNVAWGLVDAIMYLMNTLLERGHAFTVFKKMAGTKNDEAAREIVKEEIHPLFSALLENNELDQLSARLKQLPTPTKENLLTNRDFVAAIQIFLLVFLSTFPVALPFAIFDEVNIAMRASNGVALFLLFIAGYKLAGYAGFRPIITALIYTAIGVTLVIFTIALGG